MQFCFCFAVCKGQGRRNNTSGYGGFCGFSFSFLSVCLYFGGLPLFSMNALLQNKKHELTAGGSGNKDRGITCTLFAFVFPVNAFIVVVVGLFLHSSYWLCYWGFSFGSLICWFLSLKYLCMYFCLSFRVSRCCFALNKYCCCCKAKHVSHMANKIHLVVVMVVLGAVSVWWNGFTTWVVFRVASQTILFFPFGVIFIVLTFDEHIMERSFQCEDLFLQ